MNLSNHANVEYIYNDVRKKTAKKTKNKTKQKTDIATELYVSLKKNKKNSVNHDGNRLKGLNILNKNLFKIISSI